MKKTNPVTLIALCAAATAFGQGSLTPPGAPAPSMKTLQQVEPRIDFATVTGNQITQSGSYYLSGNLVVSNSIGISITASDVTLDLNGFKILHAGGQSGKAIYISAIRNITIKNGSIQEFEDGIYMYGSDGLYPTSGSRLENLKISRCTGYGLFVGSESLIVDCTFGEVRGDAALFAAANSTVKNCTTKNSSGGYGFQLLNGANVSNCSAIDSGSDGFHAGSNSVFQACTATLNDGDGFDLGAGTQLSGCTSTTNANEGFTTLNATLHGCTANNNVGGGINATSSSVSGCVAINNGGNGIHGSVLTECTARYNKGSGIVATSAYNSLASGNEGDGFEGGAFNGCTASYNEGAGFNSVQIAKNCIAESNSGDGFYINRGTAEGCIAQWNKGSGIVMDGSCRIIGNNCHNNKSWGIEQDSTWGSLAHNLVDSNNVQDNKYGIQITKNLTSIIYADVLVRNISKNNDSLDFDFDSNSKVGTIQSSPVGAGAWDNFTN